MNPKRVNTALKELEQLEIGGYVPLKSVELLLLPLYTAGFEDGRKFAFANRTSKSAHSTPIIQYDSHWHKINEFDSVREAATANGYSGTDELFKLLKSGKMNIHGHYYKRKCQNE